MKCLNSVVENFAFDVCYEKVDDFADTHEAINLIFETDTLEVFPTIPLSTIDDKISQLNSFVDNKMDMIKLEFGNDDLSDSDYNNTVIVTFQKVEPHFVKVIVDLTMYDFEYKYLCQSFYKMGIDTLSVEDLTIKRRYSYLTTLSEVEKFSEYLKSYAKYLL